MGEADLRSIDVDVLTQRRLSGIIERAWAQGCRVTAFHVTQQEANASSHLLGGRAVPPGWRIEYMGIPLKVVHG